MVSLDVIVSWQIATGRLLMPEKMGISSILENLGVTIASVGAAKKVYKEEKCEIELSVVVKNYLLLARSAGSESFIQLCRV